MSPEWITERHNSVENSRGSKRKIRTILDEVTYTILRYLEVKEVNTYILKSSSYFYKDLPSKRGKSTALDSIWERNTIVKEKE